MDDNTMSWVLGAALIPFLGWCFTMTWLAWTTREKTNKLVEMHEEPDKYGFGTQATNKLIDDHRRMSKELVHYFKWFIQQQTGQEPPPPVQGMDD